MPKSPKWTTSEKTTNFKYYPNSPALSNSNPEIWTSNKDLVVALKGSLKYPPKSWWWAKLIPTFLYPFIISILKSKSKNMFY